MEFLMIRSVSLSFVLIMLSACASHPTATRQYFDEKTAATITQTVEPWTFIHERPEAAVMRATT